MALGEIIGTGVFAVRSSQLGARAGRSSRDGAQGLSSGCSTPQVGREEVRALQSQILGLPGSSLTEDEDTGSAGKETASTKQGQTMAASGALRSPCVSQPVPTHWASSCSPAQPVLLLIPWERAAEATNLPCLIPHFSQRFKKHPWLTAEEGVLRPSASGPCSLGQSIRKRARCWGWSLTPQINPVG